MASSEVIVFDCLNEYRMKTIEQEVVKRSKDSVKTLEGKWKIIQKKKGLKCTVVSREDLLNLYSAIDKLKASLCAFELIVDGGELYPQDYCGIMFVKMMPHFTNLQMLQLHLTDAMLNSLTTGLIKYYKFIFQCITSLHSLHTIRLCVELHNRMNSEAPLFVDQLYQAVIANPNIHHVYLHEIVTLKKCFYFFLFEK
ncbi:hypothetical protein RFI_21152 [Reticulomyxa filosa]|uniref:Uncharacterized protein n=1 Tax=Reticulomyxa filosa TaxID=46433 RepID=X6MSW7_RETFI|nr:hypothetical protein RFI_21152 [Reticulomyxa filosa]|eukprot:ETO16205.1 hypothetical protein RFI_21152 [Reticulomyxa filosa]